MTHPTITTMSCRGRMRVVGPYQLDPSNVSCEVCSAHNTAINSYDKIKVEVKDENEVKEKELKGKKKKKKKSKRKENIVVSQPM